MNHQEHPQVLGVTVPHESSPFTRASVAVLFWIAVGLVGWYVWYVWSDLTHEIEMIKYAEPATDDPATLELERQADSHISGGPGSF